LDQNLFNINNYLLIFKIRKKLLKIKKKSTRKINFDKICKMSDMSKFDELTTSNSFFSEDSDNEIEEEK